MDATEVSGGCCGLAGSWGFENGKYDISLQCGEQALLQAIRDAAEDTLVIADGFSCKTQIEQSDTGDRRCTCRGASAPLTTAPRIGDEWPG